MIFVIGFLLFRPYRMQSSGMLYAGDDYSYFAHATSLVYGQFPAYEKEYFMLYDGKRPMHGIGSGLMAAPFVFLFSTIDRLTGNPIVQQRRPENITQSWTLYGFVIASIFYLWAGCFFLYKALRYHFEEHESVLAVFLMVICQGIPLFAYRRPVFSHIFEFFAMCVLVWWMLLPKEKWSRWSEGLKGAVTLGIVLGLLELVRLNDVMMILIWPLVLFGMSKKVLISYGIAGALVLGFYVLPVYFSHSHVYGDLGRQTLLVFNSPVFYFQRLRHILTGIDWGLIYTAPFVLIALASAVFIKYPLRRMILLSILPLLVNLYVIICWRVHGGWYGYRYFVPVAAPLFIYPLALLLSWAGKRWSRQTVLIISLIIGVMPLLSMLAFEGNSSSLTLTNTMEYFGMTDWANNAYQINVWKTLVEQPLSFGVAVFKGGPLYIVYCLNVLMHHQGALLARVKDQYPSFSCITFFRTLFIYCLPFLLWMVTLRCRRKGQ